MAVRRVLLSSLVLSMTLAVAPAAAQAAPTTLSAQTETVQSEAVPTTGLKFQDIRVADGVVLKSNLISPTTAGKHPAIVFVNSWGLNDAEYLAQALTLAHKGYVVLSYTARGFYGSGGTIDTAGPADISDASSVIDWLIANTAADPAHIGMGGISYGAGISLIAATQDSRIRAVAAMSGWADMTESLYGNQTRRPQALWLLRAVAKVVGHTDADFDTFYSDYMAGRNVPILKAWGAARSAATYLPSLQANKPALFMANAYGDSIFGPNSLTDFFTAYNGPKRLELSPGDHAIPEIAGILGLPNHVWTSTTRWFDQYLAGTDPGMADGPVVLRVRNSDDVESYPDWAHATGETVHYQLGDAASRLTGPMQTTAPAPYRKTFRAIGGTVAVTGVILLTNGLEVLTGTPPTAWLPQVDRLRAAVWQSPKFSNAADVRGIVKAHLALTPSAAKGTVISYLYDVDSGGVGRLITHAPVSWADATPGVTMGTDVSLAATAWNVAAGHRLALVIDTQDPMYIDDNAFGAAISISAGSWLDVPLR